jgi:hypothetical protein
MIDKWVIEHWVGRHGCWVTDWLQHQLWKRSTLRLLKLWYTWNLYEIIYFTRVCRKIKFEEILKERLTIFNKFKLKARNIFRVTIPCDSHLASMSSICYREIIHQPNQITLKLIRNLPNTINPHKHALIINLIKFVPIWFKFPQKMTVD